MYAKYGSFIHGANTVDILLHSTGASYSDRGEPMILTVSLELEVLIIGVGATTTLLQDSIRTQMNALTNAYSVDGLDFAFYHDDGTLSAHYLTSSGSLTGVRVMKRPSWKSEQGGYATGRTATIQLEAQYKGDADILAWQETLQFVGTGGPMRKWIHVLTGAPQRQIIYQRTTQKIIQSGSAIGFLKRPPRPPPLFPGFEHEDQQRLNPGSPKWNGQAFTHWPQAWEYTFELASATSGEPNRR
jgi:hypothetical protein